MTRTPIAIVSHQPLQTEVVPEWSAVSGQWSVTHQAFRDRGRAAGGAESGAAFSSASAVTVCAVGRMSLRRARRQSLVRENLISDQQMWVSDQQMWVSDQR